MYTLIDRRKINQARLDETTELAGVEFFPKLQAADGFIGFYLVADGDLFTGIIVWNTSPAAGFCTTKRSPRCDALASMSSRLVSGDDQLNAAMFSIGKV